MLSRLPVVFHILDHLTDLCAASNEVAWRNWPTKSCLLLEHGLAVNVGKEARQFRWLWWRCLGRRRSESIRAELVHLVWGKVCISIWRVFRGGTNDEHRQCNSTHHVWKLISPCCVEARNV